MRVRVKGIPSYFGLDRLHHWNTSWVGMVTDDGEYSPCLGRNVHNKVYTVHSHNKAYGLTDTTDEEPCLFEFAVPPETK